jgi:hypothetical protein
MSVVRGSTNPENPNFVVYGTVPMQVSRPPGPQKCDERVSHHHGTTP